MVLATDSPKAVVLMLFIFNVALSDFPTGFHVVCANGCVLLLLFIYVPLSVPVAP